MRKRIRRRRRLPRDVERTVQMELATLLTAGHSHLVVFKLKVPETLVMLSVLQLALRHPSAYDSPSLNDYVRSEAQLLGAKLSALGPAFAAAVEVGWHTDGQKVNADDVAAEYDRLPLEQQVIEWHTSRASAWLVLGGLQLAAVHPQLPPRTLEIVRRLGDAIVVGIGASAALQTLAAAGWNRRYDVRRSS